MKTTQKITIFLPNELLQELATLCNSEFRTRSEVICKALRGHLDQRKSGVIPTKDELSLVHQERTDFRRGSSKSLKRFVDDMHAPSTHSGVKTILRAAAERVSSTKPARSTVSGLPAA